MSILVHQVETGIAQFAEFGVARLTGLFTAHDLSEIDAMFPDLPERTAGARSSAFTQEAQRWLASHPTLAQLAGRLLGIPTAHLTRLQAFDKSAGSNWFVPWHQDRAEDGVDRPVEVLESTVALRIHLDDCNVDNGPLEVLPGTHLRGRLDANAIKQLLEKTDPMPCLANRGDIIAMRPLLVHRSQRACQPNARRVMHLEFSW